MIQKILNIFEKKLTEEEKEKVNFISKIELFNGLNTKELLAISRLLYERKYKENEIIFFRNDAAQALYLVKKGTVYLSLDIQDNEEQIMYCQENTCFGFNALLENQKRKNNAQITSEKAVLYVLPQTEIRVLLNSSKELKSKIYYNLSLNQNRIISNLFETYRKNIGFFELKKMF